MKAVFIGPNGSGQSTLVNRILGVAPDHLNNDIATRAVVTHRNIEGAPFRLIVRCVTVEVMEEVLRDLDDARRVYYACVSSYDDVSDDDLLAWLATSPNPWLSIYKDTVEVATRATEATYTTHEHVIDALLDLMSDYEQDLFIDNISIEGNFPILGPGGSCVDLPYFGLSAWMDAKIAKELANATHAFYVADYTCGTTTTKKASRREVDELLPQGMRINVCFTHSDGLFAKLLPPAIGAGVKRPRLTIRPPDMTEFELAQGAFEGRELTTHFFENAEGNTRDKHLFAAFLAFMKREAEKTAQ